MSFSDGLKVVAERASAMDAASTNSAQGMVSILGASLDTVMTLIETAGNHVYVANYLCAGNVVVAGLEDEIDAVIALAGMIPFKSVCVCVCVCVCRC